MDPLPTGKGSKYWLDSHYGPTRCQQGGHYQRPRVSRPASSPRAATTTTPRLFHLITTDRGDVIELLTDTGNAFANYRYDAWGNVTASSSQQANCTTGSISTTLAAAVRDRQPLRYAGYASDSFSSLCYLSARYYDPATVQFISKDPAKADGEESTYQCAGGEPVGKVDPSGMSYAVFRVMKGLFDVYRKVGGVYRVVASYRAITGAVRTGYSNSSGPIPPGVWTIYRSERKWSWGFAVVHVGTVAVSPPPYSVYQDIWTDDRRLGRLIGRAS